MDFEVYAHDYIKDEILFKKNGTVKLLDLKTKSAVELASNYFNILEVTFESILNDGEYGVWVEGEWKKQKNELNSIYRISYNKNKRLKYDLLNNDVKKCCYEYEKFIRLYDKYIKFCIESQRRKLECTPLIGWARDDAEIQVFMGISKFGNTFGQRVPLLFNLNLERRKKLTEKRNEVVLNRLFDWILGDANLLGIFAYTVHALCYHFCGGGMGTSYKEDVFSICIHGKDIQKVHVIANLLSNMFEYNDFAFDSLKTGSYISSSSIKGQPAIFNRIISIPVIVAHKTNRITKNSSIIRTYHDRREDGKLGFFPVYVSRSAINGDEIIDFSVNDIPLLEDCYALKEELNLLLMNFIMFLQKWEEARYKEVFAEKDWNVRYTNEIGRLQRKGEYDLENIEVRSKILLNIACEIFADFLRKEMGLDDIFQPLKTRAKHVFMETDNVVLDKQANAQLTDFALFVKHTLLIDELERPFLCVEKAEPRTNEECIYLDLKQGYRYYVEYCKQKGIKYFEQDTLKKSLGAENIIKQRSNKGQYDLQRVVYFKGEKYNEPLLVIFKDQFVLLTGDH